MSLTPVGEYIAHRERQRFATLFGGAALLLVMACVNATALMLARQIGRRRETLVQAALGASAWQLALPLVLQTAIIAAAAGGLALLAAGPLLASALRLLPDTLFLVKSPAIDLRVWMFVAGASLLSLLIVTALPISWTRGARAWATAPSALRSPAASMRSFGARALIAGELALGFVLLAAAAGFTASLVEVSSQDPGFDVDGLALVEIRLDHSSSAAVEDAVARLVPALERVPGVRAVGIADGGWFSSTAGFDGSPFVPPPGSAQRTGVVKSVRVTHGFFAAAGIRPVAGRLPSPDEIVTGAPVTVVSRSVAADYWPARSAIGQRLSTGDGSFEVIGVVPDARFYAWDRPSEGEVYLSLEAHGTYPQRLTVLVRSEGGPLLSVDAVSQALADANAAGTIGRLVSASNALGDTVRIRQLSAWLFSTLAVSAVLVLAVGLFGITAMSAEQRTREIGIRLSLGATRSRMLRLLLQEQLGAVASGLAVGVLGAVLLSDSVAPYLYGIRPSHPLVWCIPAGVLLATAAAGVLAPGLRATRIDPVAALRID